MRSIRTFFRRSLLGPLPRPLLGLPGGSSGCALPRALRGSIAQTPRDKVPQGGARGPSREPRPLPRPAHAGEGRSRDGDRKGRAYPPARAAHVVTGRGRAAEAEEGAGGWARAGGT